MLGSPVVVRTTLVVAWPAVVAAHTLPDSAWPAIIVTHTQPDSAWPNTVAVVTTLPAVVATTGPCSLGPGSVPSP